MQKKNGNPAFVAVRQSVKPSKRFVQFSNFFPSSLFQSSRHHLFFFIFDVLIEQSKDTETDSGSDNFVFFFLASTSKTFLLFQPKRKSVLQAAHYFQRIKLFKHKNFSKAGRKSKALKKTSSNGIENALKKRKQRKV